MRTARFLFALLVGLLLGAWCQTSAAQTPQYYTHDDTTNTNSFPFNVDGKDVQLLYLAGELNQPSAAPAGTITSVSLMPTSSAAATFTDLTIKLGQSATTTDLTSGAFYSGTLTEVYYRSSVLVNATAGTWLTFTLDTPFPYDPTQSLIVDVGQCGFGGTGFTVAFTNYSGARRVWSVGGCPFVPYASSSTYNYNFGVTMGGSSAPTVTTGAASSVSVSGATLNGSVNANGNSTAVTFEYGATTAYGSSATAAESPVTGSSVTAVSAAITGLSQNSTYHFRAVGVSSGGTVHGDDATFATLAASAIPALGGWALVLLGVLVALAAAYALR